MILLLPMLVYLLLYVLTTSQKCTGPVSFTNDYFTIRGPCPNYTVLVAVGSTIRYRCDYTDDKVDSFDIPYWHIPGLSGTPFINSEGSEHGLSIEYSTIKGKEHTILGITVNDQYLLNTTLNIQCGLCSMANNGCNKENRLSGNISSMPVKFVTFNGNPRNLKYSINGSTGMVSLNWSPPTVSADYDCSIEQCFDYEVQLTNDDNSQLYQPKVSWQTYDNWLHISGFNLTKHGLDSCISYKWNVTAIAVGSGEVVGAEGSTIISFQKVSNITSNVSYGVANCFGNISVTAFFNVAAVQPLDTLDYFIVLNISMELYYFAEDNSTTTFNSNTVSLSILFPSAWIDIDSSTTEVVYAVIGVSNECGVNTTDRHEVPFDNVTFCLSPTNNPSMTLFNSSNSTTTLFTTSNIPSSPSLPSVTSSPVLMSFSSISPSPSINIPSSAQQLIIIVIPVSIGVLTIILCILLLCVLSLAVYTKKNTSNKVNLSKALNNTNNSNDIADGIYTTANEGYSQLPEHTSEIASYVPVQIAVSDYLTPCEAKQEYQKSTSIMSSSLEAQYCEPAQLISRSPSSGIHSSIGRAKGNSMKMEEMTEVPGYCVPPPDFRNSIKNRNNTLTRDNNRGKESQGHPRGPSPENEPPPTYSDISDMKAMKKIKLSSNSYAELNLSPTDDKPPPLPPPHQLQMTYSTIVNTHDNVD